MNNIIKIRQTHDQELEKHCKQNGISFSSMLDLLESEKSKKLVKRNTFLQQTIDKEIDKALEHEN